MATFQMNCMTAAHFSHKDPASLLDFALRSDEHPAESRLGLLRCCTRKSSKCHKECCSSRTSRIVLLSRRRTFSVFVTIGHDSIL